MKRLSLLAAAGLFAAAASTPTGMPGWQPPARPRSKVYDNPFRHQTKAGTGRRGRNRKPDREGRHYGAINAGGKRRNLRKLLGTRG